MSHVFIYLFFFLMKPHSQCIYLLYTNPSWHNSSAVDAVCKGGFTACNSHQPHVFLFWRWLIIPLFQKLHLYEYYSQVSAEWNCKLHMFQVYTTIYQNGHLAFVMCSLGSRWTKGLGKVVNFPLLHLDNCNLYLNAN